MSIGDAVAVSVFALGLAGYLINAWLDRKTRAAGFRTEAYLDYLRAQNIMSTIKNARDPEFQRMDALGLDARSRILVYGSRRVIEALKQLKAGSSSYLDPSSMRAFTALISAMREDSVGDKASLEEVARILVLGQGVELPQFVLGSRSERS